MHLHELPNLSSLSLRNSKITDDGLKHLQAKEDILLTPMADAIAKVVLDDGSWKMR